MVPIKLLYCMCIDSTMVHSTRSTKYLYQRRPLGTARARALSLRAQLGGQLGRVKALSSSRFLGRTQPRSIAGRGSRVHEARA